MNFDDIPQYSQANYQVNSSWKFLDETLKAYEDDYGLEIEPDFQRSHVWTEEQQRRYVEYRLRNGMSGRDIYFNCTGFTSTPKKNMVLVDGLQRLTAVRKFMANELAIFDGHYYKDFGGHFPVLDSRIDFIFHINDLPTRKDVLQWYIDLNEGGTIHTSEEIHKVKKLLANECNSCASKIVKENGVVYQCQSYEGHDGWHGHSSYVWNETKLPKGFKRHDKEVGE